VQPIEIRTIEFPNNPKMQTGYARQPSSKMSSSSGPSGLKTRYEYAEEMCRIKKTLLGGFKTPLYNYNPFVN